MQYIIFVFYFGVLVESTSLNSLHILKKKHIETYYMYFKSLEKSFSAKYCTS